MPHALARRRLEAAAGSGAPLAAKFVNASTQALTIASNSSLQLAGTDWAICGWCKFDTVNQFRKLVVKQTNDFPGLEYGIHLNPTGSGGQPALLSFTSAAAACQSATVIAAGVWHWFYADYDNTGQGLSLAVDNAAPATQPSGPVVNSTGLFGIGYYGGQTTAYAMDGQIRGVGVWKRRLTAGEQTTIFAAGRRALLRQVAAGMTASLVSIYDTSTPGNPGFDSFGTNHLTNVNGVTQVAPA